jgi:soluble lytic murein transglycosylase
MSDPEYAAKLGSHHLKDLLQEFDGSYIMAAAAYNAGSSRVRRWNRDFGDPRKGQIDPIDWVESIPYSETRNYVQRVMENMEVYRARLNYNQAELKLTQNLSRGTY